MGNGISADQGNYTTCGLRDVRATDDQEQQDWSTPEEAELAGAPNIKRTNSLLTSDRNLHTNAKFFRQKPAGKNEEKFFVCIKRKNIIHFVQWDEVPELRGFY